jgi:hypothetical protein
VTGKNRLRACGYSKPLAPKAAGGSSGGLRIVRAALGTRLRIASRILELSVNAPKVSDRKPGGPGQSPMAGAV